MQHMMCNQFEPRHLGRGGVGIRGNSYQNIHELQCEILFSNYLIYRYLKFGTVCLEILCH